MARCGIENLKEWEICKAFQLVCVEGIYVSTVTRGEVEVNLFFSC